MDSSSFDQELGIKRVINKYTEAEINDKTIYVALLLSHTSQPEEIDMQTEKADMAKIQKEFINLFPFMKDLSFNPQKVAQPTNPFCTVELILTLYMTQFKG